MLTLNREPRMFNVGSISALSSGDGYTLASQNPSDCAFVCFPCSVCHPGSPLIWFRATTISAMPGLAIFSRCH